MVAAPSRGDGGARTVSSIQTLSPGGEPQLGKARFSSPRNLLRPSLAPMPECLAHSGIHPIHMLSTKGSPVSLPIATLVTLAGKGLSRGRCPVNRFPWMESRLKLPRFSIHNGNSPDSRLCARNSSVRLDRFPSSVGIDPLRLLLLRNRRVRLDRLPSSVGIDPVVVFYYS